MNETRGAAAPAKPRARERGAAFASTIRGRIARLAGDLADWSLPRLCLLCSGRLAPQRHGICADCCAALPGRAAARCRRCALRLTAPDPLCPACAARPAALDACIALADYEPPLDRVLQALKFRQQWALGVPLGLALGQSLAQPLQTVLQTPESGDRRWLLCPVPLSETRLRERGFNQSLLIARGVRRTLQDIAPPLRELLHRTRETTPQTLLDLAQRKRNLDGAFAVSAARAASCSNASVLLIDDVMTTGATMHDAARALKAAGAANVVGLLVARTA